MKKICNKTGLCLSKTNMWVEVVCCLTINTKKMNWNAALCFTVAGSIDLIKSNQLIKYAIQRLQNTLVDKL